MANEPAQSYYGPYTSWEKWWDKVPPFSPDEDVPGGVLFLDIATREFRSEDGAERITKSDYLKLHRNDRERVRARVRKRYVHE